MINFIKEACVESLEEALKAERLGADRIELCADLSQDGITPEKEMISKAKEQLLIPIRVMIRPRGGNFVYAKAEYNEMKQDVEFCKEIGVEGVVFGILNENKTLDIERISGLVEVAKPLKVVIHKAIDETPDILKATQELTNINGISTILSSGGKATAKDGILALKSMIDIAGNKLEIMPAGRVTYKNLDELHKSVDAKAYHGRQIVGDFNNFL